ncbi:CUB domain-containing protein 1 [Ornithorhynchus anatinus]|nr:CUB domain-containing protein 1 [Ornithorhynchus anatinus]
MAGRLLLLLAAAQPFPSQAYYEISLPPGDSITVTIKLEPQVGTGLHCKICFQSLCWPAMTVRSGEKKTFYFNCINPEKYFVLTVHKEIDCTAERCPSGNVMLQPPRLPPLNKTFTWHVKADKRIGLELQFPSPRLKQIVPGSTCPDLVSYSIRGSVDTRMVNIGTFCSNGTVSQIKLQGGMIVDLKLPWNENRNSSGFSFKHSSPIKRLCIIESVFEGEGEATLMSANYPEGLPEDELMSWGFTIPPHLRTSVSFLNYTLANCANKEQRVEYHIPGSSSPEVIPFSDKQPGNIAGNFNISLLGCDQDTLNPGALRLLFQVLVQHPQNESSVTYEIDLSTEKVMMLTIEPRPVQNTRNYVPACLICQGPRICSPSLTLKSGSKYTISFLCNDLKRLWMFAEKNITCLDARICLGKSYTLRVPDDIVQLPVELNYFAWKLLAPKDKISIEMTPMLRLQQHTQEKPCTTSFRYILTSAVPGQDLRFGYYCPGGSVAKIQVKQDFSVMLRKFKEGFSNESSEQGLVVKFIAPSKDEGLFTVIPDLKGKVYLRTPYWDRGLPPLASASWNITVPKNQVARLEFSKERMGVACETGRAYMIIREQIPKAEEMVTREDELLPKPQVLHHSFWVNVSNCSPMKGKQLDLLFWVTLSPRKADLTVVILAAVGGGATLLFALGLVICYTKRKKKDFGKHPAVGIYNSSVNIQAPGQAEKFRKRRKDNDSHVYAVIEDTMVYRDLLKGSNGSVPEVDVYRPFEGPTASVPPSPPPICSRAGTKRPSTEDFSSFLPVSESEPYTFSHPKPDEQTVNGDTAVPLLDGKEQGEQGEATEQ